MSAIAAIFRLNGGAVEASSVERVLDRLEHRGIDDKGVWTEGPIGIGHRMRWTTPESHFEKLPFRDPKMGVVITFDGRLDNRKELSEALSISGTPEFQVTDSEYVLRAYQKWGDACLPHLLGDFVFAIWNERERTLFAARDPLGVKHVYYYYQPGRLFALATEIKALFAIRGIPKVLNDECVGDYLVANSEDKENTFYKDIRRLPATHALSVNDRRLNIWEYWKPEGKELSLKSNGEYQEMFRELFSAAVTSRLRSSYPVGSMLSGGLDSSSIVCVASKFLKDKAEPPLHTFSAIFPTIAKTDPRIDERRFMRSVIESTGCIAHMVTADEASPFSDIKEILWHTDHPVGAPMYMDWEIFKSAKAAGVRTVLSGIDGDSTVSHGYEDLANFVLRGQYFRLIRESLALRKNMPRPSHSLKRLVWRNGIKRRLPSWTFAAWRKIRGRESNATTKSPIAFPLHFNSVNREFREAHDLEGRIRRLRAANFPDEISPIEYHWRALTGGHFAEVLENLEKASAAFGVEARFPFFDRRLIEFCISLPPGQRIYRGWTRSIFRHAMDGLVPPDVLWRSDKSNIGASVKVNMLKFGADQLARLVGTDSWRLNKYSDLDARRSAFDAYRKNPLESDDAALFMLTNVYLLNWLEQSGLDESRANPAPMAELIAA
ncbi:MAG: asparagine synthase (glutamine-hydrolyzing) [Pyrinomonadaceae bacterium]